MRQGDLPLAKELFRQVIDLRPESDTGYNNLASTHILAGELVQAEPLLQAALRIHPNPAAHDNLGFVFYSTERYQEAALEFRKAIEAGNDDAMSWGNLGDAYRQMERTESARKAYENALEKAEEALRVNPNDLETRMGSAMVLAGLGRCTRGGPAGRPMPICSARPTRPPLLRRSRFRRLRGARGRGAAHRPGHRGRRRGGYAHQSRPFVPAGKSRRQTSTA